MTQPAQQNTPPFTAKKVVDPALDPTMSAWVSASAGSGKTTLLTRRVLRLLIDAVDRPKPRDAHILCLTYTKAAAAEMQNRLYEKLGTWAVESDDSLRDELHDVYALKVNTELLKKVRRHFTVLLDKPDQVRILTLHSFCQMLLKRFPLEAGLAPHFTLLEGDAVARVEQKITQDFFKHIAADPDLSQALNLLSRSYSTTGLGLFFSEIFKHQARWTQLFHVFPTQPLFEKALRKQLGISETDSEDMFWQRACVDHVDEKKLRDAAVIMLQGSKTDCEKGDAIAAWLSVPEQRTATIGNYARAFFTDKNTRYAKLVTKSISDKYPDILITLEQETARIERVLHDQTAWAFLARHAVVYKLAHALWHEKETAKAYQAKLTFDDVILKAAAMLKNPSFASWILYKLDGGLDHLLIDEAQDTSPPQWHVIEALLEEFLSGEGDIRCGYFLWESVAGHTHSRRRTRLMKR
jgi:ATP-dependent helicase/nuclease subunit A